MIDPLVEVQGDAVVFRVRATPRARSCALSGVLDGIIGVRVAAPPVEGKANEVLRAFLAQLLGVRVAQVTISSGERSRHKKVEVRGITREHAVRALGGESR